MAKRIEPAGDFVLVVDHQESSSLEGIDLPDNVRQKEMLFGTIVAVGPKVEDTRAVPHAVIAYGPYAGMTLALNGMELRELREGQIAAYIVDDNEQSRPNAA